jgi:hypothetical protein
MNLKATTKRFNILLLILELILFATNFIPCDYTLLRDKVTNGIVFYFKRKESVRNVGLSKLRMKFLVLQVIL